MLVEWESSVVVRNWLLEVGFGSNVVSSNTNEEGGKCDEESKTDGVVDFSLADRLGSPLLALGVVPFSILIVVDELILHWVKFLINSYNTGG